MKLPLLLLSILGLSCIARENSPNILLIVNYNHPHYESIPLLKKIYGPYFKHIVFYGPYERPDVYFYPHQYGYFSYMCISDAMQKYPGFDGYLFLHDDCILNAWKIQDLDSSKIWFPLYGLLTTEEGQGIDLQLEAHAVPGWYWWQTSMGCPAMTAAFNELPQNYKNILEENWVHCMLLLPTLILCTSHPSTKIST